MPRSHGVDLSAVHGGLADEKLTKLQERKGLPPHVKIMTAKGMTNWITGVVPQNEDRTAIVMTHTGPVLVDALGAHGVHLKGDQHHLGSKDPSVVIECMHVVCVPDDNFGGLRRFVPYDAFQAASTTA